MKADGSRTSAGEYRGPRKGCSGTIIDPCGAKELKGRLLITTPALTTPLQNLESNQHMGSSSSDAVCKQLSQLAFTNRLPIVYAHIVC